jgi:predicted acyltransferase
MSAESAPQASPESPGPSSPAGNKKPNVKERLLSLDAFRGLIMLSLVCGGFGLRAASRRHLGTNPDSGFWQWVNYQFNHTQWNGCSVWDIIMPCFLFMVGMSMAYSSSRRKQEGQSFRDLLRHAIKRSVILISLGFVLDDLSKG